MIRQQINLYVRHETVRVPFAAPVCALIVLITALLSGGLYALEARELQQLQGDLSAAQAAKAKRSESIAKLQRELSARKVSPALQQQQQQLSAELRARQQFGRMLDQLQPAQRVVFSALLQGLAEQTLSGLWLTEISARDGGLALRLRGATQQPELIPRYLRRLGGESSYRAAEFGGVRINQRDRLLEFEVSGVLQAGGAS